MGDRAGVRLVASALLALLVVFALRHLVEREPLPGAPNGVGALIALALCFAVGRLVLALLPAGPLGGHGPAELPATWAASHLLGWLVLPLQRVLFESLGLASAWWIWTPWVALGAVRVLLLPGSLVPGPVLPGAARGRAGLAAVVSLVAWSVWQVVRGVPSVDPWALRLVESLGGSTVGAHEIARVLVPATHLAAWFLFADGLAGARRGPGLAWLAAGFLAVGTTWCAGSGLALALSGAGLASAIAWLRRADRRGLVLAALLFGGCAFVGEPYLWAAGTLAIVLAGRGGLRQDAWRVAGVVAGLVLASLGPWVLHGASRPASAPAEAGAIATWALLLAVALTLFALGGLRPSAPAERRLALLWIALATLLHGPWLMGFEALDPLARVVPGVVLLAVIELVPEGDRGRGSSLPRPPSGW